MKVKHLNTAAALLLAGFSMNAFAADPTTGTLTVTADITASCGFTTATNTLAFGPVDLAAGGSAGPVTLVASCTTTDGDVFATATGLHDATVGSYTYAMNDGAGNYVGYNMNSLLALTPGAWDPTASLEFAGVAGVYTFDFSGSINAGDQEGYTGASSVSDTVTVAVTF